MNKRLLVLGDSHAHIFKAGKFGIRFPEYDWSLCYVMGATLIGLQNENSKTKALEQYRDKLGEIAPDVALTLIGEVDIGYHVWFKNKANNEPVEKTIERILASYVSFWTEIKKYTSSIICVSTPLPTIPDHDQVGDVALSRKFVDASQLQRTEVTLLFNQRLKALVAQEAVQYLDLDLLSLGDDGLVIPDLLHPNRFDHHYFGRTYSNMLVEQLSRFL
ncbi:hypothetical protein [Marinomonas sp. GJ51-6]|uniref:hypothetical protein n=1 Tax=Marinomonas sp. GJ51-6 TaxID=2992802 RepID=UPI0029345E82|nr:hypothetical protein [Marinomonas sp. GJ51-6]WOD06177.1 hypothetical protein ONZ50_10545 [Marinomonas sp. GJ51-6]